MNDEVIVAIFSSIGTLLTAAGLFFARSKLSDVLISGPKREETAVGKMADMLGVMAEAQIQRELKLIEAQMKAVETVDGLTKTVIDVAGHLQIHETNSAGWVEQMVRNQNDILGMTADIRDNLTDMGHLLSDVALQMLQDKRERQNGKMNTGDKKEGNSGAQD